MRFFSGIRDNKDKKKSAASEAYKRGMNSKPGPEKTADEKYQDMINARTAKLMEDYASGKRTGFRLPGTKDSEPNKEMSKNAKQMMQILAQKKAQQEMKKEQKKQAEWERSQKAKKQAAEHAANLKKQQEATKLAADQAAQQASAAYWEAYYNSQS